jgi:hypothetical protein
MTTAAIPHAGITDLFIQGRFDQIIIHAGEVVTHAVSGEDDDVKSVSVTERLGTLICSRTDSPKNQSVLFASHSSMTIINGRVISVQGEGLNASKTPLRLELTVPAGTGLSVNLVGAGMLVSTAVLGKIALDTSGANSVTLGRTAGVRAELSGATSLAISDLQGPLQAEISGAGGITARGAFPSVDVRISGAGHADLRGDVMGDAIFQVSGAGSIRHSGVVRGSVRQKCTGVGDIRVGSHR